MSILIEIILACIIWIAVVQTIVALMLPISLICICLWPMSALFGGNTDVAIRDMETDWSERETVDDEEVDEVVEKIKRISAQKVAERERVRDLGR
jgi:hypothetical protein